MEDNKWESELEMYRSKSSEDEVSWPTVWATLGIIGGFLFGWFIVQKLWNFLVGY
ncbi:MAG: hypothetical protein Q8Q65_01690 [bacterium]|nr:hypothetical protein [bacterium]